MTDASSEIIDDRVIPVERPNESDRKRIRIIHSRLGALRYDLRRCTPSQVCSGVQINQFASAIEELGGLTGGRDYNSFMPRLLPTDDGSLECLATELRSAVVMLIEELREEFVPEQLACYRPPQPPSPMTFSANAVAQAEAQNITEMEINFIANLKAAAEPKIDEQLASYTEGSNEHTFLSRLKAGMVRVRSFGELMTLANSIALAIGMSEHEVHLLLRALGINL